MKNNNKAIVRYVIF